MNNLEILSIIIWR